MGRKANDITFKEPVRIREKELKDGNKSLYLDIYMNGNRKKEGLKLYLVPEVNAAAKAQNKNTMKLAEQVKVQRILDIQKVGLVDWEKVKKINTTLLDYMDKYVHADEHLSPSSTRSKKNIQVRVKEYIVSINDVMMPLNKEFCKNFIAFLANCTYNRGNGEKPLSSTTQRMFVNRLGTVFENAMREGLIMFNPVAGLDRLEKFPVPDTHREFLTPAELERFLAVETTSEQEGIVQHAFGFSCMTGLRSSDMHKLKWSDIKPMGDGWCVSIVQQKTKQWVTVPLNDKALSMLPMRPEDVKVDDIIFKLVKKSDNIAKYVRRISKKAGIIAFLRKGYSVRDVAKLTGKGVSTVMRVKKEFVA